MCIGSDTDGKTPFFLGMLFALKSEWEKGAPWLPVDPQDRQNFSVELSGFAEDSTKVAGVVGHSGEVHCYFPGSGYWCLAARANSLSTSTLQRPPIMA